MDFPLLTIRRHMIIRQYSLMHSLLTTSERGRTRAMWC